MNNVLDLPPEGAALPGPNAPRPNQEANEQLRRWITATNIADELSDDERGRIAQLVIREYRIDEESRAEWMELYDKWMKFALQITEPKTFPWPDSSNIIWPLMTTASIQFAARAYPAIIRDRDVVKGSIEGPDDGVPELDGNGQPQTQQGPNGPQPVWRIPPGLKKQRADKIGQHMSWQLLEEQEEWEPQTDRMLIILPIVGLMFRKSYFDPAMQRNVSETVTAKQLCVNYNAKSFETAPRLSELLELYPWQVEEQVRAGIYLDEDYGTDQGAGTDDDAPITFIEQHRRYDLDGDGYPEPYIVTVARDSGRLARIKAAYDEDGVLFSPVDHRVSKIEPISYYTKYGFIPNPESEVYDIGFGNLLYPINCAINTALNQLVDAGTLANTGGGFIGAGLSINTGAVRFQLGEYKPVNTQGTNIRDNVFPIPFPGPNQVLFELLQFLVDGGEKIAAVKDVMVGDLPGDNTSGVATLAMIEQGLKVFSAIYKRIHRSLKQEFRKLFRLNRIYLPQQAGYQRGSEWHDISQADYQAGAGVEPISDPQMITDMQKLGRAQFLMQFRGDPWIDQRSIREEILDAALFPNVDKLLLSQQPPDPALGAKVAELHIKQSELDLRSMEAKVRAVHEEADLAIRRGKDKASAVLIFAQAINQLAQASKADHEVNQAWYSLQIDTLKAKVDAFNAGTDDGSPAINPADIVGIGNAAPANGPGVQPMAPPSSVQGGPALPVGPGGGAGGGGA